MSKNALDISNIREPNVWQAFAIDSHLTSGKIDPAQLDIQNLLSNANDEDYKSPSTEAQDAFRLDTDKHKLVKAAGHSNLAEHSDGSDADSVSGRRSVVRAAIEHMTMDEYFDRILNDLNQQIKNIDHQIADIDKQITVHQERIVEIGQEVIELETDKQKTETKIEEIQEKIEEKQKEVKVAEENLEKTEKQHEEKCDERDKAREKVQEAETEQEQSIATEKFEQAEIEVSDLELEIEQNKESIRGLKRELTDFKKELETQQNKLDGINQKLDELNTELETRHGNIAELEAQKAELEVQKAELETQKQSVLEQQANHEERMENDPAYAKRANSGEHTVSDHIGNLPEAEQKIANANLDEIAKDPTRFEAIMSGAEELWEDTKGFVSDAVDSTSEMISGGIGAVGEAANSVYDSAKNFFSKPAETTATVSAEGEISRTADPTNSFQTATTAIKATNTVATPTAPVPPEAMPTPTPTPSI